MSKEPEYTEEQKAIALRYAIEKFGEDITSDPEEVAMIMEIYIDGMNYKP